MREHLEVAAASPRASPSREMARAKLEGGPEAPAEMEYLRAILHQVHGRSGVGMGGLAPLSHGEILDWCTAMGQHLEPGEVEALVVLDGVMLSEAYKARPKSEKPRAQPPRRGR